jgi:hypothetical protein
MFCSCLDPVTAETEELQMQLLQLDNGQIILYKPVIGRPGHGYPPAEVCDSWPVRSCAEAIREVPFANSIPS